MRITRLRPLPGTHHAIVPGVVACSEMATDHSDPVDGVAAAGGSEIAPRLKLDCLRASKDRSRWQKS